MAPAADRPLGAHPAPPPYGGPERLALCLSWNSAARPPTAAPGSGPGSSHRGPGTPPGGPLLGDKPPSLAPAVQPTLQPSPAPRPSCPAPAILTTGTHAHVCDAPRQRLHGLIGKGGLMSQSGWRTERSSREARAPMWCEQGGAAGRPRGAEARGPAGLAGGCLEALGVGGGPCVLHPAGWTAPVIRGGRPAVQVMQRRGNHVPEGQRPSSGLCPPRTGAEIRKPLPSSTVTGPKSWVLPLWSLLVSLKMGLSAWPNNVKYKVPDCWRLTIVSFKSRVVSRSPSPPGAQLGPALGGQRRVRSGPH